MNESSSTVNPATPSDPKTESTESNEITSKIIDAIKTCYDPEIPVNVVDLGLVYNIDVTEGNVYVQMTLTAPGCGMGPMIAQQAEWRIAEMEGVEDVEVEMTFDPPWTPDLISEDGKKLLGLD